MTFSHRVNLFKVQTKVREVNGLMMIILRSKNNWIGAYQVLTSLIGLIIVIDLVIRVSKPIEAISIINFILWTILLLYGVVSGYFLLEEKHYTLGLKMSISYQTLQVISFDAFGLVYKFFLGLNFMVNFTYFDDMKLRLFLRLFTSNFLVNHYDGNEGFIVGISIMPIIILILLLNQKQLKSWVI